MLNSSVVTGLGVGAALYLAACAWLYFYQHKLIYFPSRTLTATPAEVSLEFEQVWLETRDGLRLHAWFVPAPAAGRDARRAALFFHGNAGNISDRLQTLRILNELELDALIVQYRGYGSSEGEPTEAGTYHDALAGWRYLVERRGFEPDQIVVFGRSLGGGIASWLAHRLSRENTPPAALIMESTFTSIPDAAAVHYPLFPVHLLARVRYPSLERMGALDAPLLVMHAPDDRTIPFSHGERLFAAAREPKQLVPISGPHGAGFLRDRAGYVRGLASFLQALDTQIQ